MLTKRLVERSMLWQCITEWLVSTVVLISGFCGYSSATEKHFHLWIGYELPQGDNQANDGEMECLLLRTKADQMCRSDNRAQRCFEDNENVFRKCLFRRVPNVKFWLFASGEAPSNTTSQTVKVMLLVRKLVFDPGLNPSLKHLQRESTTVPTEIYAIVGDKCTFHKISDNSSVSFEGTNQVCEVLQNWHQPEASSSKTWLGVQGDHPQIRAPQRVYWNPSFGLTFKGSSLGAGVDLGFAFGHAFRLRESLSHAFTLRGGFNGLNFNHTVNDDGIRYASTVRFRSYQALVDINPFGDLFHLSGGVLFKNGNQVTSKASVSAGQTFSLGGTTFLSNPFNPITGTGRLTVGKSTAPMVLVGFGNLIPRHHTVIFFGDMGVVFQGRTRTALSLSGSACDPMRAKCDFVATAPTIQPLIRAEENKINHQLGLSRYYPVVSLGLAFGF